MLTGAQLRELAERVASGEVNADDAHAAAPGQFGEVIALAIYMIDSALIDARRRKMGKPQRRALSLLREFLTPEQTAQLRRNGSFYVTAPSGRTYRLSPADGWLERVERHGRRWVREGRYCYHEDRDQVAGVALIRQPLADRTIGQMLMLLADEARFLAEANWTPARHEWWDGTWRRQVREAQRQRREGCGTCGTVGHNDGMHDEWVRLTAAAGRPLEGRDFMQAWMREQPELAPLMAATGA